MLKKMKLAPKMAIILGGSLIVVFLTFIIVIGNLSRSAISKAMTGELNAISESNGNKIQQVFDITKANAVVMRNYLLKAYQAGDMNLSAKEIPTQPEIAALFQSSIYKTTLNPLNYDSERFLVETARNTATSNEDIAGMGVMFEPYQFQPDIKDYAFYMDQTNRNKEPQPLGTYETYSAESYYQEAAETMAPVVTEPYDYNGQKLVTYAVPIIYNSKLMGVVKADLFVENFKKVTTSSEKYPSMYATIYDEEGDIIYDSEDLGNIGKSIYDFTPKESDQAALKANFEAGAEFEITTTRESGKEIDRFFTPLTAGSSTWWSLTAVDPADIDKAMDATKYSLIFLSAAALLILILITNIVLRSMLRPMDKIVEAAEKISNGDLNVNVTSDSADEIGILSRAFEQMVVNLRNIVEDLGYILGEIAGSNFNVRTRVESSYIGDFQVLLATLRNLVIGLSSTMREIDSSADQVSSGSEQVASGAQALSQGTTQQASSLEELAATINEISSQVQKTSGNADKARELTALAGKDTEGCSHEMQQMIQAMSEISSSSSEIGKIIKTIEDIAFQTNILALNAAVEAARAGQAGKGFAVVADEVRSLAGKASEASKSTAALIENSIHTVEKGTNIASQTSKSLSQVVERTNAISELVDRIASDAREQASSISQVTQGVDQISSVVQTNSATAEESAAASQELSGQSRILKELVEQFVLREER